jgi:ribonuclease HII
MIREGVPLEALRRRAQALDRAGSLSRLARALEGDSREGARALSERCARRADAIRSEARRLRALFALRRRLFARGVRLVAGVDEVGMGPLAGPVVAAAVILPERVDLPGLDDSKRLDSAARERLDLAIRAQAVGVCVAEASHEEIDALNIYRAGLLAMARAVAGLRPPPECVLVDGRTIPDLAVEQRAIAGGDARDGTIAAASVVAKVYRDALMRRLASRFPGYGLERHKGYATAEHLAALRRLGPSRIHRRSTAPVAELAAP